MQYIKAPSSEQATFPSLFLAGGITNCPDWQDELARDLRALPITIFNPRRDSFPNDLRGEQEQVSWEFKRLRDADLVSFWFDKGSFDPITLFELGSALERLDQPIVIGIDPGYARKVDVELQMQLRRPEILALYSLPDLTAAIRSFFA